MGLNFAIYKKFLTNLSQLLDKWRRGGVCFWQGQVRPLFLRGIFSCFVFFKTFHTGNERVARDLAKSNLHSTFLPRPYYTDARSCILLLGRVAFCTQVPVVLACLMQAFGEEHRPRSYSHHATIASVQVCFIFHFGNAESKQTKANIVKASLSGGKSGSAYP